MASEIAGIIGGDFSGCTDDTKNVFLEVALFNPDSVAKTGRSLGINSDARCYYFFFEDFFVVAYLMYMWSVIIRYYLYQ